LKPRPRRKISAAVLLVLIAILVLLSRIPGVEEGIKIGYPYSAFVWGAFILSLAAVFVFGVHLYLRWRLPEAGTGQRPYYRFMIAALLALAALIIFLQFGTGYLRPIEQGILDGYAPLSLGWAAAIITLLINAGLVADSYLWSRRASARGPEISGARGSSPQQVGGVGAVASVKGRRMEVIVGNPQDVSVLTGSSTERKGSPFDRDEIQTRNNISEWILSSLPPHVPLDKDTLEEKFEEQFPKTLWPLFNSVLYDLIYRNKVVMRKENQRSYLERSALGEG
jgi:hypothetical protein